MIEFPNAAVPEVCVPFDFNGSRLLWLEYKQGGKKELQAYDFASQEVIVLKEFSKSIDFVSHVRLYGNYLI